VVVYLSSGRKRRGIELELYVYDIVRVVDYCANIALTTAYSVLSRQTTMVILLV